MALTWTQTKGEPDAVTWPGFTVDVCVATIRREDEEHWQCAMHLLGTSDESLFGNNSYASADKAKAVFELGWYLWLHAAKLQPVTSE